MAPALAPRARRVLYTLLMLLPWLLLVSAIWYGWPRPGSNEESGRVIILRHGDLLRTLYALSFAAFAAAAVWHVYARNAVRFRWWKPLLATLAIFAVFPLLLPAVLLAASVGEAPLEMVDSSRNRDGRTYCLLAFRCSCGVFDHYELAEELSRDALFHRLRIVDRPEIMVGLIQQVARSHPDRNQRECASAELAPRNDETKATNHTGEGTQVP